MKAKGTAVKIVTTLVALAGVAGVAEAQGPTPSANRGKILFLQCVACHDLKPAMAPPPPAPGASAPPLKIGPHLGDIVGRKAGVVPAPVLSSQLKASGIVWTEDMLDKWIEKPGNVVPGTAMVFAGLPKPEDRQSIVLYLKRETGTGIFSSTPADAASRRDRDLTALRAVHDAWLDAYSGGDVEALERFYGDDSVIMSGGRPTYRGWPEIRALFAPGFERWKYAARADLQYLDVSGDLGTAQGVVTLTFTPKAGGPSSTREMRYLIVFKRQPRGDWRVLLDMDNRAAP